VFEDEQQHAEPPRRPSALRRAAVATALMGAVVAGGYGVAAAQTDETPGTQDTPGTTAPDDGSQLPDPGRGCDHGQDGTAPGSGSSSSGSTGTADATSL
jgi:hypothetical protein